jgi:DNA-binding CsgD family transcriptional regulator
MQVMMHGDTMKACAGVLSIAPKTVEFHLSNVRRKMKVHNLAHALCVLLTGVLPS